tara:strand:+ start:3972 stop:4976 length:1005 start_codon:yes stop_codon:yes gene_type:complete
MKVNKIFVEENLQGHESVSRFCESFPKAELHIIDQYENYFQKVKKPYLQKHNNNSIFLAEKRGNLVKAAPDAYGLSGEPHYYYIHAYNCMYECQYCYLQGYFQSPDLVFFLNHEDIVESIRRTYSEHPEGRMWFHAGEFSDSLALSHLSKELPIYFRAFQELPRAYLELRTKSANTKELEKLDPLENIIVSFSFSSHTAAKKYDLKTASISARIQAMYRLYTKGYRLALHLDPIIDSPNLFSDYQQALKELFEKIPANYFSYISLGVVRFTKDVFEQTARNYPESDMLAANFVKSFDNKVRYSKPLRDKILYNMRDMILRMGITKEKIYLCMED